MTAPSSPSAPFRPALLRLAETSPLWMLAVVIMGVALMALSAQVEIHLPPVPVTLQSYVLVSLAALLGWRLAGLTIALYVALGLMGLPVFLNGLGGLALVTGPSAGFMAGFLAAAALVGWLEEYWARRRVLPLFAALALGQVVQMGLGALWLARFYGAGLAFQQGFLPFLPGAVLKTIAALATVILVERLAGTPPEG